MQCLYCDAELKPFRGLFDEDFCCRDHREKYFSSFRKAVNRLPVLDIPEFPTVTTATQSVTQDSTERVPQDFIERIEEPVFSPVLQEIQAEQEIRAEQETQVETVEPLFSEALPATEESLPAAALTDIPTEAIEQPLLLAKITAEEPDAADVSEEIEGIDLPVADFLHPALSAMAGALSARTSGPEALFASCAIELPKTEMLWAAAVAIEERPAELLEPSQMTAVAALAAMPVALELSLEGSVVAETAPGGLLPEAAGLAEPVELHAAFGYASLWNYTDPLAPEPPALTVFDFCPQDDGAALLPAAEFAELTLLCRQLVSAPIAAPAMMLAHEFDVPVFAPSCEIMASDEAREGAQDQMPSADSTAPAEIAPALVMSSAPIDRPALMPACAAEMMPPALQLSSARSPASPAELNVPGLASTIEAQPDLSPELMADIPQAPAANQAAQPHTHAPLRALFGSSVKIKNWRLRITFAKPA